MDDALMDRRPPEPFEVVVLRDAPLSRRHRLADLEAVVIGHSVDEDSGEVWCAILVRGEETFVLPATDLERTGRSVPRSHVYPGSSARVSRDGKLLAVPDEPVESSPQDQD
ncbi:hypothetical protein [Demequina zhanjiangensis]|uniref:Uncharacterized protein n=1 Tax=Demequina zhanjiangensis TaxID=3051659 RepID=A0ABT8G299_9MICO|nr:hypothetical protein [Demequina sp. SYSU T00b26]MDN4472834.1 hypothetical protein [Demequina sp. SYSU T00b26]